MKGGGRGGGRAKGRRLEGGLEGGDLKGIQEGLQGGLQAGFLLIVQLCANSLWHLCVLPLLPYSPGPYSLSWGDLCFQWHAPGCLTVCASTWQSLRLPASGALRAAFALAKPTHNELRDEVVHFSMATAEPSCDCLAAFARPSCKLCGLSAFQWCLKGCLRTGEANPQSKLRDKVSSSAWQWRPSPSSGFSFERAAVHQQCVALVSVAFVASQSSPAQLELGRFVFPVARVRLRDLLLVDMVVETLVKLPATQPGLCGLRATVHSQPSQRGPIAQAWDRVGPSFDSTNAGPGRPWSHDF